MIYRTYGKTGKKISAIGFGGMRFPDEASVEKNAELVLHAHSKGITYFDTAPYYCQDRSEAIVGAAVRQMKPGSFYLSTKSGSSDGRELRASLERSLERLGVSRIHFFNIWCIQSAADWEKRKQGGAVEELLRARDEGLVEHVVCSTHMVRDEASAMLEEGIFEGVTLGYNAVNFPFREQVVNEAARHGMGIVTMNPLNGGLIPQNADRFDFIRTAEDPDVVSAALRFILSNPAVTSALVGFSSCAEIDQAVQAAATFRPLPLEHRTEIQRKITAQFEGFCTGCGYCLPCPQGLPIPRLMDAYNMRILKGPAVEHLTGRLKNHWSVDPQIAGNCTGCGQCEQACTQHLPIIERMQEIAAATA
jgi:predicted aldo/keto reductase-like oxidoreductase